MSIAREVCQWLEIDAESGVKVKVEHGDNGSRLVMFSRPVKVLELSTEEATTVGSSLIRDRQTVLTPSLRALKQAGFFRKPRSFAEIKKELRERGLKIKSTSLNMALVKLVDRQEVARTGKTGSYLYQV